VRASSSAVCSSSRIEPYRKAVVVKSGRAERARPRSIASRAKATPSGKSPASRITPSACSPAASSVRGPLADQWTGISPGATFSLACSKSQRRRRSLSVSPAHSRRISSTVWVSVSTLASLSPISGSGESPTPMPHTKRPGASRASVAAALAVIAGWRVIGLVTAVPTRRVVVAASASVA